MNNIETKIQDWRDNIATKVAAYTLSLAFASGTLILSNHTYDNWQEQFCQQYGWLNDQPIETIDEHATQYAKDHTGWWSGIANDEDDWYHSFMKQLAECDF